VPGCKTAASKKRKRGSSGNILQNIKNCMGMVSLHQVVSLGLVFRFHLFANVTSSVSSPHLRSEKHHWSKSAQRWWQVGVDARHVPHLASLTPPVCIQTCSQQTILSAVLKPGRYQLGPEHSIHPQANPLPAISVSAEQLVGEYCHTVSPESRSSQPHPNQSFSAAKGWVGVCVYVCVCVTPVSRFSAIFVPNGGMEQACRAPLTTYSVLSISLETPSDVPILAHHNVFQYLIRMAMWQSQKPPLLTIWLHTTFLGIYGTVGFRQKYHGSDGSLHKP